MRRLAHASRLGSTEDEHTRMVPLTGGKKKRSSDWPISHLDSLHPRRNKKAGEPRSGQNVAVNFGGELKFS